MFINETRELIQLFMNSKHRLFFKRNDYVKYATRVASVTNAFPGETERCPSLVRLNNESLKVALVRCFQFLRDGFACFVYSIRWENLSNNRCGLQLGKI